MISDSRPARPWIGEILFRTRKAAGLPSRAMADLLGMPHSTYYKIETGARAAPDEAALQRQAEKVAADLKVDFSGILSAAAPHNDAYYTPREVVEELVQHIEVTDDPRSMLDPVGGTGGFLAAILQSIERNSTKTSDMLPVLPIRRLSRASFGWIDDPSLITFRPRPQALVDRSLCYAIKVITDAMVPRYELEDLVVVAPDMHVNPGDDCILSRASGDHTVSNIVRVHAITAKHLQVRQFAARPETFIVPIQRAILHRIVPLDELL
jgi:transcriptional regulator with XRE-family HTH domain